MEKHQAHVRYTAEEYDHFTANFIRPFDESFAAAVQAQAVSRPGGVVLDIGTGTARFLIHLAKLEAFAGFRLVGTDLFPDMIERARLAADKEGCPQIELLVEDVHSMSLPEAFADIVVSRSTIHHWSDPIRAFREIYRVMKPGAIAMIVDVRRDAPQEARDEFNRIRAAAGLPESFFDEKYTASEVEEFCRQAGIENRAAVYVGSGGLDALGLALIVRKPRAK